MVAASDTGWFQTPPILYNETRKWESGDSIVEATKGFQTLRIKSTFSPNHPKFCRSECWHLRQTLLQMGLMNLTVRGEEICGFNMKRDLGFWMMYSRSFSYSSSINLLPQLNRWMPSIAFGRTLLLHSLVVGTVTVSGFPPLFCSRDHTTRYRNRWKW